MRYRIYIRLSDGTELRRTCKFFEAMARLIVFLRDFKVKSFAVVEAA